MALEVDWNEYLFSSGSTDDYQEADTSESEAEEEIFEKRAEGPRNAVAAGERVISLKPAQKKSNTFIPFRHNPLHDLESIFWLALYLVVCPKLVRPEDSALTEDQWQKCMENSSVLASSFFNKPSERWRAFQSKTSFKNKLTTPLVPEVHAIITQLETLRQLLYNRYHEVERDMTDTITDFGVAKGLYLHFITTFQNIAESLKHEPLKIRVNASTEQQDNIRTQVSTSPRTKHKRSASQDPTTPEDETNPSRPAKAPRRSRKNAAASVSLPETDSIAFRIVHRRDSKRKV